MEAGTLRGRGALRGYGYGKLTTPRNKEAISSTLHTGPILKGQKHKERDRIFKATPCKKFMEKPHSFKQKTSC
jgi:hypothetical protein